MSPSQHGFTEERVVRVVRSVSLLEPARYVRVGLVPGSPNNEKERDTRKAASAERAVFYEKMRDLNNQPHLKFARPEGWKQVEAAG